MRAGWYVWFFRLLRLWQGRLQRLQHIRRCAALPWCFVLHSHRETKRTAEAAADFVVKIVVSCSLSLVCSHFLTRRVTGAGGNTDMDFCNIRKAAASFISMSLILVLASIGLSALSVMELPYSSSAHGYSTLLQLLCFLFTMVGFSLLANLKLHYDDAKGRLNYDLDYGPTFYLIVLAWVMHILSLLLHVLVDPGEGAPVVPLGQMRYVCSVHCPASVTR